MLLPFILRFSLKSKSPKRHESVHKLLSELPLRKLASSFVDIPPTALIMSLLAKTMYSVETVKQTCWLVNLLLSCRL